MKVVIAGAGISGLATAFWLKKAGAEVIILEKREQVGGSMRTLTENGYLIDFGPNSALETTPLIKEIVDEVGLTAEMMYADAKASKRYILKNGELMPLPMSPPAFLKTRLFSTAAKIRLMKEPFIGKSDDGYYQSIAQFVVRRLGQEFLDYAISPFVSGVFAGDPGRLSVKSAFPKLYRLEELYGGLIKGTIKGARERKKNKEKSKQSAKMFSFRRGMTSFPEAIASHLGTGVVCGAEITGVERSDRQIKVTFRTDKGVQEILADKFLSTMPAKQTAALLENIDAMLPKHLNEIYYPPVKVLYLGYKTSDIPRPLDGFGFLIPAKEKRIFLGAIWSSVLFPNRAPEGKACFTLFVGGATKPHLFEMPDNDLNREVISQFSKIMGITAEPDLVKELYWEKAIPQYNLGYIEHENYFERFEVNNPGFYLGGNYRGGISVGDCVKNSKPLAEKILQN